MSLEKKKSDNVSLYRTIKASYGDKNSIQRLENKGFIRDNQLSNHNQSVFYNKQQNKTIMAVAGTHNLQDWGTDVYLAVGKLKNTNRYKEAKNTLEKAREKYKGSSVSLTGHSLGSGITNGISSSNERVYNLDPAYTIGQKARPNVTNYRAEGDIVSLFSPKANTKTFVNNSHQTGFSPVNILKAPLDALNAHNVSQIKGKHLFV